MGGAHPDPLATEGTKADRSTQENYRIREVAEIVEAVPERRTGEGPEIRDPPAGGAGGRDAGRTARETPTGRGDVGQERPLQL